MNNISNFKTGWILLVIIINLITFISSAQEQGNWLKEWNLPKAFIENKGQFDGRNNLKDSNILYGIDHGSTSIFFTSEGLTYRFYEIYKNPDREKGDSTKPKRLVRNEYIHMIWENANTDVEVVCSELTDDYHTYSMLSNDRSEYYDISGLKGYQTLTYKNLYDGIDVVYEFHPQTGIKYSLIIQPGADISKVSMKYSDNTTIEKTINDNLHISTNFGNIIEHAPYTFYAENQSSIIPSSFNIQNNSISFNIDHFDTNKQIIIDPWIVTPILPNSNGVWELDKDNAGNIYIIGGDMPMKLQKYSATGSLQWTYSTPWDTANFWLGTLTADQTGNCYITAGSSARIQKVNTSGSMVWSANGGAMDEYWMITFNCDHTKLIVGGTRLNPIFLDDSHGVIFDININNGSVITLQNVAGVRPGPLGLVNDPNEVRALTSSRNARYYYLTLEDVGCINQNFSICSGNSPIYHISSDYHFSYKSENYRPSNGNAGIRAIRANDQFVYTQNGVNIQKRSLNDGSIITSVPITGGISTTTLGFNQPGNNGIAVDDCGNVYVGSGNRVIKFDANLNELAFETTNFPVFDVVVSTGGNIVAVGTTGSPSSTNRIGNIQSFNMSACAPFQLSCCLSTVCPIGPFCHTDPPVQLITEQTGGTFSGPGVNPTTGLFSPTTAGPGNHTITYTLPCGSSSISIVVNFCDSLSVCVDSLGNLVVNGGIGPYQWDQWLPAQSTPITNQSQCVACGYTWVPFVNQCLNGVIPVTTCDTPAGWAPYATGSSVAPPPNWPVRVTDNSSNTIILNNYASIPDCPDCPALIMNISNFSHVSCYGMSDGEFSVTTTGGATPYDYTLLSGTTTIASFNNVTGIQNFTGLAAGTYTLNVLDNDNCPGSMTITINQPDQLIAGTPVVTNSSCGLENGSINVTPTGGTPAYLFQWSTTPPQTAQTATGLPAGNYSVTVTDNNGCTATATATVTDSGAPVISTTTISATCGNSDGSATANVTGGTAPYTYIWNSNPPQNGSTLTYVPSGNYIVTVTDSIGCTASASATITDSDGPGVTISLTNSICENNNGSITLTITGGLPPYQVEWSNGSTGSSITNLPAGIYSFIITDSENCIHTGQVTIYDIMIDCDPPHVYVPNIFSPNGDGENDVLYVRGESISFLDFVVYNRWGQKMFETSSQNKGWDGTYKGKPVPAGVYVYHLKVIYQNNNEFEYKGDVTVVR